MSNSDDKIDLKLVTLGDQKEEDKKFIYNLIEQFLKTNLSITFLTMPSFDDFFKIKIKRRMVTYEEKTVGFVQMLENGEVGYFIDPSYQGKGIATKAVELLMDENPRERYFASINNDNIASIDLVKRLGFHPKATVFEKIIE